MKHRQMHIKISLKQTGQKLNALVIFASFASKSYLTILPIIYIYFCSSRSVYAKYLFVYYDSANIR